MFDQFNAYFEDHSLRPISSERVSTILPEIMESSICHRCKVSTHWYFENRDHDITKYLNFRKTSSLPSFVLRITHCSFRTWERKVCKQINSINDIMSINNIIAIMSINNIIDNMPINNIIHIMSILDEVHQSHDHHVHDYAIMILFTVTRSVLMSSIWSMNTNCGLLFSVCSSSLVKSSS